VNVKHEEARAHEMSWLLQTTMIPWLDQNRRNRKKLLGVNTKLWAATAASPSQIGRLGRCYRALHSNLGRCFYFSRDRPLSISSHHSHPWMFS
jgi:hypothetical protein